jgi:hypothetical protein
MATLFVRYGLLFCAGAFFHMCALHFFHFEETAGHPMIRMWRSPCIASALWACVQLAAAVLILFFLDYRLRASLEAVPLFVGFCLWGILRGVNEQKRINRLKSESRSGSR